MIFLPPTLVPMPMTTEHSSIIQTGSATPAVVSLSLIHIYYGALHDEAAQASVVVPVDKLSIVVTVLFSWIFLKERLSKKAAGGLVLIVAGTLLLLL